MTVLLSEPPRSQGDLNFELFGTPVRVHPYFWVISLLFGLGATRGEPLPILIWVGVVFVSILAHEFGHALVAQYFGWPAHITLYGMGGLASYRPTHHDPRKQILISLAGPGAGFIVAALTVAAMLASRREVWFEWQFLPHLPIDYYPAFQSQRIEQLVDFLLFVNVYWGLVNLLPVYPLDGGQIAREALQLAGSRDAVRQSLGLSIVTGAAVAIAIAAYFKSQQIYMAFFFAYLAYTSYVTMQAYFGRGGPRGGWQ